MPKEGAEYSTRPMIANLDEAIFVLNDTQRQPNSVDQAVAVNRESPRDFAILEWVANRKRAILDADLAGRDAWFGVAVNKKPAKTRDLTQRSRDSRLGFLFLPDWLSFEPVLKGSPKGTLFVTVLSTLYSLLLNSQPVARQGLRGFETLSVAAFRKQPLPG
jgi:hypothetical protein